MALDRPLCNRPTTPEDKQFLTPAMRQYCDIQESCPNCILLYRLGDFYETFFEQARLLNQILGLTLTHRGNFRGQPIDMCGVPASTLDQYLVRLVKLGQSVAICEQVGDPQQTKGMMERKIVRIVTPGTLTDSSLLSEKADSVLLAIDLPKGKTTQAATAGLVWITLTNGDFRAVKTPCSNLSSEIARIAPSEILVTENARDILQSLITSPVAITELNSWNFDADRGSDVLKHRFGLNNLQAWGLEGEPSLLAAINALLGYIEQTQCDALPFIRPIVVETESSFIALNASTRHNLEISETLRNDNGPTLFSVIDHCTTSMGSRLLKHWLHHPLRDREAARARHTVIDELIRTNSTDTLRDCLRHIPDIERIAGRIALKSIRPKELAALRDALPVLSSFYQSLQCYQSPLLIELAQRCTIDAALFDSLDSALLEEPSTFLREGDVIKASFSPELQEFRALRDNTGDYLTQLETRERERTGLFSLRVEYNRVSGYYIEVSKGQADKVPADYRRRQTLKNTERFITPELKEYEDKALSAKERAFQIEKQLWDQLVDSVSEYVPALIAASEAVASIDAVTSFAHHAILAQWVRPTLSENPGIDIEGARHPVVEHMIEHYVPNHCRMVPGRRLLVITGPNMGGKSTFMRSIALIVLLSYAGSFIPATAAQIGPIDKILTRIGASDDLARGRSTFMVEMTEAAAILHQATDQSLVLMDEIGRGTSTFDGLSLAGAIAQDLSTQSRSWTLFATHYFELTHLAQLSPEVANVHVSAEQTEKGIVFLHDISDGPASQSYGIAVAKLAGVPARVIRQAKNLLKTLESRPQDQGPQLDLFAAGTDPSLPEESPQKTETDFSTARDFIQNLGTLDIDALSPREALNCLYQLRDEAKNLIEH